MLTPEPMRHLALVVLTQDLEAATRAIAREGVLHLLDVRQSAETLAVVRPYDVSEALAGIEALCRRLATVATTLSVSTDDAQIALEPDGSLDLELIAARIAAIEAHVEQWGQRAARQAESVTQLEGLLRNLRAMAPLGLPVEELRAVRFVHFVSGLLPTGQIVRLRESMAHVPHLLLPLGAPDEDGRVLIAALTLRPNAEVLERALRSVQLEPVAVPPSIKGTPAEAMIQIEEQLRVARGATEDIQAERPAVAERVTDELRHLCGLLSRERLLTEAHGRMGGSERVALVSGWVPAVLAPRLEQAVRQAVRDHCVLHWQDARAVEDVRHGRIPVPILFHNPVLVRPFERLVRNYGMPHYGEIDPTPLVAIGFLAMFGFMFGDVGQGLVLFGIGYFMYRRMFRYRDYAIILMECGLFAAGFGFLYGSVFGVEHWLPALWLRPMEDMPRLIRTALAFGVVVLSIGFLLNLWNAIRRRDLAALWKPNGLLFAVAYWSIIGVAIRRFTGGPGAVSVGSALLWLTPPLLIILVREPIAALWAARQAGERPNAGELGAALVQSIVELLDTLMSTISNTATFIRLAAFALSHAGLFMATFCVADAVARAGGGTIGAGMVIIFGNVLIIALEGMIVSIQTIRLEYYEFFSKFYSGGGAEYRPFRLTPDGRAHA